MTTPIPPDAFQPDLVRGESIEWSGQPNASVIFHQEDRRIIPFTLLWGGFAIFWFLAASGFVEIFDSPTSPVTHIFYMVCGMLFVLVGQYAIWGRFVYTRWKKKRTYYALTNRRALIVIHGFFGRRSSSAWFIDLLLIDKRVQRNGIGFVSFGGPATAEARWGTNNPPRPPTFDDVDNADDVYQTAIRMMEKAHAASASQSR